MNALQSAAQIYYYILDLNIYILLHRNYEGLKTAYNFLNFLFIFRKDNYNKDFDLWEYYNKILSKINPQQIKVDLQIKFASIFVVIRFYLLIT